MAVVSAIDPRLRQRRIAVRRAEGRRRLRILAVVVAVVAVGTAAYAVTQSSLLDLDTVTVTGATGAEADMVREASGLATGTAMIELDLDAAEAAVTALPWVLTATVDREWPGSVSVEVVSRTPVAVMATGDGAWMLIDTDGVATQQVPVAPLDLPVIGMVATGDAGDTQTEALALLPLVAILPDDLRPWIETLRLRDDGASEGLELDLVGSAVADLGDGRFLAEKLEALRAELAFVDLTCVVEFDVRVADIATVRRDPACEAGRMGADGTAPEAEAGG